MTQNPVLMALKWYGETPISGKPANPMILAFLSATNYPKGVSDEVPWCSAFLVFIFKYCGIATTANAAALSWMNYSVHTDHPDLGDVVILGWPKENPTNHHVGLFIREALNGIYVLAGNQDNTVDICLWKKADVLSYRRLAG